MDPMKDREFDVAVASRLVFGVASMTDTVFDATLGTIKQSLSDVVNTHT